MAITPIEDTQGVDLEERGHVLQSEIGGGKLAEHVDWQALHDHPAMRKFLPGLRALGYSTSNPIANVSEVAMHLMRDPGAKNWASFEERAEWLQAYVRSIIKKRGVWEAQKLLAVARGEMRAVIQEAIDEYRGHAKRQQRP